MSADQFTRGGGAASELDLDAQPLLGRRSVLSLAATTGILGTSLGGYRLLRERRRRPPLRPYSETVVLDDRGRRIPVAPGTRAELFPDSRVLLPTSTAGEAGAERIWAAEKAWLQGGTLPGASGPWSQMARYALLDLRVMSFPNGALLAGWEPSWRYVWPRDASFAAATFAAAGHFAEAQAILGFLQRVQHSTGQFEARYLPDGSGAPDKRGIQLDGTGWALWATGQVVARLPEVQARSLIHQLRPMVDRCAQAILAMINNPSGLPPVSMDYWELPETQLTLGTAAPQLAGLQAAILLYQQIGAAGVALQLSKAAARLSDAITRQFGPLYPRHLGSDDHDLAVAFLSPPIGPLTGADVYAAERRAPATMMRAAGGLAPGSSWWQNGVSWTPTTALCGLAASGRNDYPTAKHWLDWLSAHRTTAGSLPEKVGPDGSPAGPAPLAFTAAVVLLTLDQLDSRNRR